MIFGVEELMLLDWTDVRIRNDPLNELNDILLRGLTIICDKFLKETDYLNVISGYHDEYQMTIEFLYKGSVEFEYV